MSETDVVTDMRAREKGKEDRGRERKSEKRGNRERETRDEKALPADKDERSE